MIAYPSLTSILVGTLFGATAASLAFKARALSRMGALSAAILGMLVFGFGGVSSTLVLLTFFISSSAMSFLFKRKKAGMDEKHAKGSRRDAWQVLANGGVSGVMIVLSAVVSSSRMALVGVLCQPGSRQCGYLGDRTGYPFSDQTQVDHDLETGGDGDFGWGHPGWDPGCPAGIFAGCTGWISNEGRVWADAGRHHPGWIRRIAGQFGVGCNDPGRL